MRSYVPILVNKHQGNVFYENFSHVRLGTRVRSENGAKARCSNCKRPCLDPSEGQLV